MKRTNSLPVEFRENRPSLDVNNQSSGRAFFARGYKIDLAGAVGLEPTPSSLTVRCPTNWTTPQTVVATLLKNRRDTHTYSSGF